MNAMKLCNASKQLRKNTPTPFQPQCCRASRSWRPRTDSPTMAATQQNTPLPELANGSAGLGRWLLKIDGPPQERTYTYKVDNGKTTREGKAFTVKFVSEEPHNYCYGTFTKRGKEPGASNNYSKALASNIAGTSWVLTKATLAKTKPLYIGSSVKAVVDMNSSTLSPVLQSMTLANLKAQPEEDLAALLEAPANQRVDVTALVCKVSDHREAGTHCGQRLIVDVMIRDSSGPTGASECEFSMFFPATQSGRIELAEFRKCAEEKTPVAFFNLCIQPGTNGNNTLRPDRETFQWFIASGGTKADSLTSNAQVLQSTDNATSIATMAAFVPHDAVDYRSPEATLTVARVLRAVIRSEDELPHDESSHLFQMNHMRVLEPSAGQNILTSDGRLFPEILIEDLSGQIELRAREKAVLELSGLSDREEFCKEVANAGLNFPILVTARIHVRKTDASDQASQGNGGTVSAVIVEMTEQNWEIARSIPNASYNYLNDAMMFFGNPSPDRMCVAPSASLKHSPHGGLIVQDPDGTRHACGSVLTLLAHTGKCDAADFEGGHRLATTTAWNVPFAEVEKQDDGAPEHADSKLNAKFITYCSPTNVQFFTLSSRKAKDPIYALVSLGRSYMANGTPHFMINKVHTIEPRQVSDSKILFKKLQMLSTKMGRPSDATAQTPAQRRTSFGAKRARTLGVCPTDVSMD